MEPIGNAATRATIGGAESCVRSAFTEVLPRPDVRTNPAEVRDQLKLGRMHEHMFVELRNLYTA